MPGTRPPRHSSLESLQPLSEQSKEGGERDPERLRSLSGTFGFGDADLDSTGI
ncbi:hypothetical protein CROQUDRAFT_98036 [Cronartium quercuum f. sp. fusiforme G11]|uniref:Uncharacterized protein n=1 Tax=Cronartium quercuum f. sp. fusiforme G11 TaxID=708437 RepID=A0A9P6N9F0_9BASI|nr:hypothetical protein CROQUDRAFT_98036 [Cronartium quercuum f. sp. fusiforme G11]